jgi:hypothetical protein
MHLRMHTNKKSFSHLISFKCWVHFLSLSSLTQVECIVERENASLYKMTTGWQNAYLYTWTVEESL